MTAFFFLIVKLVIQMLIVFVVGSVAMMSTLFVTEFFITIKNKKHLKRIRASRSIKQ